MSKSFSSTPMEFKDTMSNIECLKLRQLWRHHLEVAEREYYTLIGAIDMLLPLWYEYDGSAETAHLFASITSVGKSMRQRLNIVKERKDFALRQVQSFDAHSNAATKTSKD